MPASQARAVIEEELGGLPLEEVFEWIDLDEPLGSASIAQVPLPAQFMHGASSSKQDLPHHSCPLQIFQNAPSQISARKGIPRVLQSIVIHVLLQPASKT